MLIGQKIGPFTIDKEIGSGAMGTVYKANFDKEGRVIPVALKVVAFGLMGNEGAMARFDRESAILKQLKHPHIVRLIATGKYKGTPFIAMEYVDGDALDRVLTRRGRLGWEDVIAFGKQLCEALQYAHDKGIIHRDLKPSNLMLTREGVLKLTDFGIAKDTDVTALTGHNSTIGTAAYMSPEQCKGDRNLSHKSDLYSLGVVFYELVTGKKPFVAETTVDMFLKHVNEKPVRPSKLTPDLPVWLDNLIMFLLEKNKDRRPLDAGTVGKMLADIEEKVRTQHSAGADAANARRIDRQLTEKELDEDDIEAAKLMRAAGKAKKGKKKKKAVAFIERAWVKAVPIAAALCVVVGLLVYYLQPPGQADLFNAWKKASGPDAKLAAAERYLTRFGALGGEEAERVRASLREIRGERLQAIIDKRFRNRTGALRVGVQEGEDKEAHDTTFAGLEAEEKGDLALALACWKKIQDRQEINDVYGDGWKWLADLHAVAVSGLNARLEMLRSEVLKAQTDELAWKVDPTQPESLAKLAVRLDGKMPARTVDPARPPLPVVSDPPKARQAWAALFDLTKTKPELLEWRLLAAREREKNDDAKPAAAAAARAEMLERLLGEVEKEWARVGSTPDFAAEQRDCRNRCRDVVQLYADESDDRVKAQVNRAQALLAKMKAG